MILDGLINCVNGLRRVSHDWSFEKPVLEGAADVVPRRRAPCTRPRVALLDLDGTLYDSLPYYVEAWRTAFGEEGIAIDDREVYAQEGRQGWDTVRRHLKKRDIDADSARVERILQRKNEVLVKLGPAPPQKGAQDLVSAIVASGLDIWVVTGSGQPDVVGRIQTDFGGIQADHVISGLDVHSGKPNPEPYALAYSRAGVYPHECVALRTPRWA